MKPILFSDNKVRIEPGLPTDSVPTVTGPAVVPENTMPIDLPPVVVEVVTMAGRAVGVDFRVRTDTVEVWSWGRCGAIFDRERLRVWLLRPSRWICEGEVLLLADRRWNGERIAVNLPDVAAWTLSPKDQAALVGRV